MRRSVCWSVVGEGRENTWSLRIAADMPTDEVDRAQRVAVRSDSVRVCGGAVIKTTGRCDATRDEPTVSAGAKTAPVRPRELLGGRPARLLNLVSCNKQLTVRSLSDLLIISTDKHL